MNKKPTARNHFLSNRLQGRRAALYLRTASLGQESHKAIEIQEQKLRRIVADKIHPCNPVDEITVFKDLGKSGLGGPLPSLERLFRAIESRKVNVLVISNLCRLSRSVRHLHKMIEFLESNECELWTFSGQVSRTTRITTLQLGV